MRCDACNGMGWQKVEETNEWMEWMEGRGAEQGTGRGREGGRDRPDEAPNRGRRDFRLGGAPPFGRVAPPKAAPADGFCQGLAGPGRSDGDASCITPSAPPQRPPRVTGSSHCAPQPTF